MVDARKVGGGGRCTWTFTPRNCHSERSPMRWSRVRAIACRAPEESSRGRSEARRPLHDRGRTDPRRAACARRGSSDEAGIVARRPAMPLGWLLQRKRTLRGAGSWRGGPGRGAGWIPREPAGRWGGRGFGAAGSARNDRPLAEWPMAVPCNLSPSPQKEAGPEKIPGPALVFRAQRAAVSSAGGRGRTAPGAGGRCCPGRRCAWPDRTPCPPPGSPAAPRSG